MKSKDFADCEFEDDTDIVGDRPPPEEEGNAAADFKIGDHVYTWSKGILYNHHAIVVDIEQDGRIVVADFSALVAQDSSGSFGSSFPYSNSSSKVGALRFIPVDEPHVYRKVKYNATSWECLTSRAGTCTTATPSSADDVLGRVHFLLHHYDLIPPYHILLSNCETVAFWCMTGIWRTLQVASAFRTAGATGATGAGAGAAYAASQTVTVPAAGLWGWLGFTSQVALTTVQPFLLPAIAVGGSFVVGSTLYSAHQVQCKWNETTELLRDAFHSSAFA